MPDTGPGTYATARQSVDAPSTSGRLIRYDVRVEDTLDIEPAEAAKQIAAVLNDERSWRGTGRWRFELVPAGEQAELHAYLVTPGTTDRALRAAADPRRGVLPERQQGGAEREAVGAGGRRVRRGPEELPPVSGQSRVRPLPRLPARAVPGIGPISTGDDAADQGVGWLPEESVATIHRGLNLTLRPLPLAEARLMLAGRPTEAMRQSWHPEYPLADTMSALALIIGAYEATAGPLVQQPAWWVSQIVRGQSGGRRHRLPRTTGGPGGRAGSRSATAWCPPGGARAWPAGPAP